MKKIHKQKDGMFWYCGEPIRHKRMYFVKLKNVVVPAKWTKQYKKLFKMED